MQASQTRRASDWPSASASLDIVETDPLQLTRGPRGWHLGGAFEMVAAFTPHRLADHMEYRQYIRGVAKRNGANINSAFNLGNKSLPVSTWTEDLSMDVPVYAGQAYGHRLDTGWPNDVYSPNRVTGHRYSARDQYGITMPATEPSGTTLELYLSYRGEVIFKEHPTRLDTKTRTWTIRRRFWQCRGQATIP